jgi:hypothetical protein
MIAFLILHAILAVHVEITRHGVWAWIQPPHIAAGIGIIRGHLVTLWQVQR